MGGSDGASRSRRRILAVAVLVVALSAGCATEPASVPTAPPGPGTGTFAPPARVLDGRALGPVPFGPVARRTWSPWPAALHDARHSGGATVDGPVTGTMSWRRQLEGAATSGPVAAPDGSIYVASNAGVLHALDPRTGADRWVFDSGSRGGGDLSTSALVMPDGTVLWGPPGRNQLVALSPSGTVLWRERLPGRPTSPTSSDGTLVYVGDTEGGVTSFEVSGSQHRLRWTIDVGDSSYGSVATNGSGRLYTTADSALVALDDSAGAARVAWRADPGDDISEVSAGLGPDGTALLGTNGVREWAYRPDGSLAWSTPRVITYSSPTISDDGLAYIADHSGQVHVLDVARGTEAARYEVANHAQIWSAVAVDRGHRLYFGTQDGHFLGVAPDGTVLFDLALGTPIDSYPALTTEGTVVFGNRGGAVVAVGG